MRALRPRALLATSRVFACLLILNVCVFNVSAGEVRAQAKTGAVSIGSMQTTGDVSLNGMRAVGEQTVYVADGVQTGTDGMAVVNLTGGGMLSIADHTELSFGGSNYVALVKQGTVEIRSTQAGRNLVLEFGKWLMYLPSYATQASARLVVGADGSARVECRTGSVGVTAQSGNAVSFLNAGQAVSIGSDGKLGSPEGGAPGSNTTVPGAQGSNAPAAVVKGSKTGYIILGAAAGGGALAAGIVLGTRHHSSTSTPVSPSTP